MKAFRGKGLLVGFLIFLMIFTAACSSDKTEGDTKNTKDSGEKAEVKEPIKIGVLASTTGALGIIW